MSSDGIRERALFERRLGSQEVTAAEWVSAGGSMPSAPITNPSVGKQFTVSESHRRNRSDGSYRSGGPFFTSLVRTFLQGASVKNHYNSSLSKFYSGTIHGAFPTLSEMNTIGYSNISESFGDKNESQMIKDGTTAIALVSPTNPASDLGTTLAETMREGIPSLPGIQSWRNKTKILKGLGSEYLNYQFGWAPLVDEISSVRDAARNHRDLLKQYQRGEGSDTHRRFDFPSERHTSSLPLTTPSSWGPSWSWKRADGTRQVSLVRETKRWFEGVFTYALPSQDDSWGKAIGFGSDADRLFGLALNPEILWELTPWSWAVDWFSNTGFVIQNVTSFGLAGLVMRYGYMMEESIERVTAEGHCPSLVVGTLKPNGVGIATKEQSPGMYSCGTESVTKRRIPASPFGFGIGWEGLSPTQLAITAALGITRLL